jgi:hypothetical protein
MSNSLYGLDFFRIDNVIDKVYYKDEKQSSKLSEKLAMLQHHDTITGTSYE